MLDNNGLSTLPLGIFDGLKNIMTLLLWNNRLVILDGDLLQNLKNVTFSTRG